VVGVVSPLVFVHLVNCHPLPALSAHSLRFEVYPTDVSLHQVPVQKLTPANDTANDLERSVERVLLTSSLAAAAQPNLKFVKRLIWWLELTLIFIGGL